MLEAIECYFSCIARSNTNFILFALVIIALTMGIIFLFSKKPNHIFLSQIVTSVALVEGFLQMSCPMAGYVWIYLGLISGAMVLLGLVQVGFDRHIQNLEIEGSRFSRNLSFELGTDIYLLDTQKIKAYSYKRKIYLSVGLLELLEPDEIKAVAAHELYHVRNTPNRFMANTLAVASLWFKSYRDDIKADRFAADLAGKENLISALRKLEVSNFKKRLKGIGA
ncbi:MAG: M48 family metalloprotease [Methanomassiliicoccales archaeon]|nr:MAG: M48 family metalloprotease [Methanomassiliicoccales archaeon]